MIESCIDDLLLFFIFIIIIISLLLFLLLLPHLYLLLFNLLLDSIIFNNMSGRVDDLINSVSKGSGSQQPICLLAKLTTNYKLQTKITHRPPVPRYLEAF